MSCLVDGVKVVGEMLFEGDGGITAVAWVKFAEEPDDEASAYEVVKGGKLEPIDLGPWAQWKAVAALAAEGG